MKKGKSESRTLLWSVIMSSPGPLVVGFDNLSSVRDRAPVRRDGWAYAFAAARGWSHLGVLAFTPTWFREAELHDTLRGLAATGFFARFAGVTMTGTSMGVVLVSWPRLRKNMANARMNWSRP